MNFKIKSRVSAVKWREELKGKGQRLVMTNGCFDILHVGHVRYLAAARALGDALIVAINGDKSVRALKGPGRPINLETDRAEVLAALESVNAVIIFYETRCSELIQLLQPDIYAKGGDYTPETLESSEKESLEKAGAQIVILPLVKGQSTTSLLKKIEKNK